MVHMGIEKVPCHRIDSSYAHLTCNFSSGILGGKGQVWEAALDCGLEIPDGYYYLADARYPGDNPQLLIPYCGVWYHLAEWS